MAFNVGQSFVHAVAALGFGKDLNVFLSDLRQIKCRDCSAADDGYAIEASWRMLVIDASNVSFDQRKEACVWRPHSL